MALVGGGVGLVTGAVASLIAPWANWGIEKRKLRRAGRVERIREWRAGASQLDSDVHFMELEWSAWDLVNIATVLLNELAEASPKSALEQIDHAAAVLMQTPLTPEEIAQLGQERGSDDF